jgi:hypothetical protein
VSIVLYWAVLVECPDLFTPVKTPVKWAWVTGFSERRMGKDYGALNAV